MNNLNFGKNLKKLLQNKNITQRELASIIGVGSKWVYDITSERAVSIRFDLLAKICKALGVMPGVLFVSENKSEIDIIN